MTQRRATILIEASAVETDHQWEAVARLRLHRPVILDQERLEFTPFHGCRHLKPIGFLNQLRYATYAASETTREPR